MMQHGLARMLGRQRVYLAVTMILCCSMMFSSCVEANVLMPWEKASLSRVVLVVDGIEVPVYFGGSIYYISNANEFGRKYPLYIGAAKNVGNKLIGIGNTVYEAQFASSNPSVASIDDHGIITFWREGSVTFTVTLGSSSQTVEVQVKEAPFIIDLMENKVPTAEDVVRKLGMPDKITSSWIKWPDRSTVLDDIFYSFGGTNDINVVHWHFDEYPTLLFRVVDNKHIPSIYNLGWDCGYSFTVSYALGIDY